MIRTLKIYAIKTITINNIQYKYKNNYFIPSDLINFVEDFVKFIKKDILINKLNHEDYCLFNENLLNCYLIFAAHHGYLEVVKYLHQRRTFIQVKNDQAFQSVIVSDRLEIVNKYIHKNGTTDDRAMELAASSGHLEVVKYLHQNGVDLRVYNDYPIQLAAKNGHLEVVKYINQNGVDSRAIYLAIQSARENGHLEIIRYLYKKWIN